jgi:RNA polymerase sigma-70 factor (ECF subfamily)
MGTRSTYDLEAVLAHTPWVRALAERLVGDPGEAEDIAQETWLAAERHRPSAERGLQPWLRAVVRRLALRKRRDRARLERRERAAARDEVEPSTSEIVLQDELRALVGRSLADLDEPFRSTLILRYFAGLEPSEIAAREGVPASTVRTRLRRGLEKLREDLDRRHGGRAVWGAACVDLMRRMDVSAGLVPAAVGGIAMQIGWKLTMAAAALALTAWVGWETLVADGEPAGVARDAERLGTQLVDVDRDAAPPELAPGLADAGREGLASAPVAASATAPADAAPRAAFAVLSGRVVDAGGRPIAGAELEPDGPGGGSGHAAHGASDPEGRFRLDVDAGKTLDDSFECSVAVRKAGFATRSVTTTVRRSAPTDLGTSRSRAPARSPAASRTRPDGRSRGPCWPGPRRSTPTTPISCAASARSTTRARATCRPSPPAPTEPSSSPTSSRARCACGGRRPGAGGSRRSRSISPRARAATASSCASRRSCARTRSSGACSRPAGSR